MRNGYKSVLRKIERLSHIRGKQKNGKSNCTKKSVIGKLVVLAIIIFIAYNFINEKKTKPVSDEQIELDIQANDKEFSENYLQIDCLSINERRTTEDGTMDMISMVVSASNDECTYTATYDATYLKYQDGWHLEDLQKQQFEYVAKADCPDNIVIDALLVETSEYGALSNFVIISREGDLRYQTVECSFSLTRHNGKIQNFTAKTGCSFLLGHWSANTTTIYHADTGKPAFLGWLFE